MNKPKDVLAVDVFIRKTPSIVSAREKCPLNTGRFYTKRGKKLGSNTGCPLNVLEPNTGHICFQNNQEANGIEGKQQSENVQEVIKNSNYNLGQNC